MLNMSGLAYSINEDKSNDEKNHDLAIVNQSFLLIMRQSILSLHLHVPTRLSLVAVSAIIHFANANCYPGLPIR